MTVKHVKGGGMWQIKGWWNHHESATEQLLIWDHFFPKNYRKSIFGLFWVFPLRERVFPNFLQEQLIIEKPAAVKNLAFDSDISIYI